MGEVLADLARSGLHGVEEVESPAQSKILGSVGEMLDLKAEE